VSALNVGDRVLYTGAEDPSLGVRKKGKTGTIVTMDDSFSRVKFDRKPNLCGEYDFIDGQTINCLNGNLEKIKQPRTLDDLQEVVDSLRDQGYALVVKVTEPPVKPKTITL
jgi:hypothetical protein